MAARNGTPAERPCHAGLASPACLKQHVAAELDANGHGYKCPVPGHADRHASLSLNVGERVRLVWCCHAGCDPADVRAALLDMGMDESCIGTYGTPRRNGPGAPAPRHADPGTVADARRFQAVLKLPAEISGPMLRMCVQAISEGDGNLPGDPERLLPRDCKRFAALARRAGINRTFAYKLYARWISEP